ncbi:MAG: hypothetical protein WAK40_04840 [Thermoplasmata archaeon]
MNFEPGFREIPVVSKGAFDLEFPHQHKAGAIRHAPTLVRVSEHKFDRMIEIQLGDSEQLAVGGVSQQVPQRPDRAGSEPQAKESVSLVEDVIGGEESAELSFPHSGEEGDRAFVMVLANVR